MHKVCKSGAVLIELPSPDRNSILTERVGCAKMALGDGPRKRTNNGNYRLVIRRRRFGAGLIHGASLMHEYESDFNGYPQDPYDATKPVRIRWLGERRILELAGDPEPEFRDVSVGEAAEFMDLSIEEIEWALEEYARCDAEEWVCWQPSEKNGEEFPTAEAP